MFTSLGLAAASAWKAPTISLYVNGPVRTLWLDETSPEGRAEPSTLPHDTPILTVTGVAKLASNCWATASKAASTVAAFDREVMLESKIGSIVMAFADVAPH